MKEPVLLAGTGSFYTFLYFLNFFMGFYTLLYFLSTKQSPAD